MDSHHYVLYKCRVRKHIINNSIRAYCKISRASRDDVSHVFKFSLSSPRWSHILLLWLLLKIHWGVCVYARRAVISPATFFPRSVYITRNNYRRNMMPVISRVLRLRETMKNNACPRRGESQQINIYYNSRSRTIDDHSSNESSDPVTN